MPKPEKKEQKPLNDYIKYAGLGFEILACMLLFVGAGYLLDQWLAPTKPWFTLGLSLAGCGCAIYLMIRTLNK
ncbi:MAG: AtpZ/AtpI family protein [Bacteroidia bacterium]|nr:AtpZ/AtpI family protein [Bacteroidia bacterium]